MSKSNQMSRYALAEERALLQEMMTPESIERQRDRIDQDIQIFMDYMDSLWEPKSVVPEGGGS